jgi:hypothetical protein
MEGRWKWEATTPSGQVARSPRASAAGGADAAIWGLQRNRLPPIRLREPLPKGGKIREWERAQPRDAAMLKARVSDKGFGRPLFRLI